MFALISIELIIAVTGCLFGFRYYYNGKLLNKNPDSSNNIFFITLNALLLIFISGFRGAFTTDYNNYVFVFKHIGKQSISDIIYNHKGNYTEVLYNIINKFVYFISKNEVVLFWVLSFITVFFIIKALKNNSNIMWLSLFIFVSMGLYFTSFNLVRQILASSMIFWGTKYLYKKEYIKFIIVILLTSLIHRSSLIAIILVVFPHIKWSKNRIKFYLFGVLGILVLTYFNTNNIVVFMRRFVYSWYDEGAYGMSTGLPATSLLLPLLISGIIFLLRKYINFNNNNEKIWLWCLIMYLILSVASLKIEMLLRFTYYFSIYMILFIPNLLSKLKAEKRKKYTIIICTMLIGYSMFSGAADLEYRFFWN